MGVEGGNVSFNDTFNTFLFSYSEDHSDREKKPAAATIWVTLFD